MTIIRANRTVAAETLRPGDSILNNDGSTKFLVQSAPEWLPRVYGDEATSLIKLQVLGAHFSGPMLFHTDDIVYASVLVGALRIRVQALKPTDTRGQRFRAIITTGNGRRVQHTIPRDYSWSATFPAKDAAREVARQWFGTEDVTVTPLYGNLTPGSISFAAQEA